jgi:sulfur carrier protein ThiS adenylyltransferase
VSIIGVGAVGRQVALQLAAIGAGRIELIDFDHVGVENLAVQGFLEEDLGEPKVQATGRLCRRINSDIEIVERLDRFRSRHWPGDVVFNCVDSIETRARIWRALRQRVSLLVDTRMAAEVVRVLTVSDEASARHYGTTLFAGSEAYRGACTARSTLYCAQLAASLAVAQLGKFLRQLPMEADMSLNILTAELSVEEVRT